VTIALGVLVPGEGVVLATDSLRVDWRKAWPDVQLNGEKFAWLGGGRIASVASGCFQGWAYPSGWIDNDQLVVKDVVRLAFSDLVALSAVDRAGKFSRTHLLMGGGPAGLSPTLALLRSDAEQEPDANVLIGGAIEQWAQREGLSKSTPPTVEAAIDRVVEICRAYIADLCRHARVENFKDFTGLRGEPGGLLPPSAPPFHVAVITPREVKQWVFLQ
jgi:hypothetical protein